MPSTRQSLVQDVAHALGDEAPNSRWHHPLGGESFLHEAHFPGLGLSTSYEGTEPCLVGAQDAPPLADWVVVRRRRRSGRARVASAPRLGPVAHAGPGGRSRRRGGRRRWRVRLRRRRSCRGRGRLPCRSGRRRRRGRAGRAFASTRPASPVALRGPATVTSAPGWFRRRARTAPAVAAVVGAVARRGCGVGHRAVPCRRRAGSAPARRYGCPDGRGRLRSRGG